MSGSWCLQVLLCPPTWPADPRRLFFSFVQLRFFRLARWWHWFHVFLKISLKYSFLLLIVFFGFVTVGFQLFHEEYRLLVCKISHDCLPRWHMSTFFHTFLSVFRMLSGSWTEILWDCIEVSGMTMCLTFIMSVVVIGNLLVSPRGPSCQLSAQVSVFRV